MMRHLLRAAAHPRNITKNPRRGRMRAELHDKVVVITGASSGIGRATALDFARAGASLALAARRERLLKEVAKECERLGAEAIALDIDTSKETDVRRLAEKARQAFGGFHIWVNNAAVS